MAVFWPAADGAKPSSELLDSGEGKTQKFCLGHRVSDDLRSFSGQPHHFCDR